MDPASASIGAAGGLLGSLFSHNAASQNRKFTAEQNRLQREFNAAEAQKSRDFQLDMFNRTNAYNTPKATVDRLVAAGLNPALAFGGFEGASFGGSAAQASSSAAGSSAMPDYSGITSAGQAIMQSRLIDAEIDLKESEAEKNRKDTSWIDRLNSAQEGKYLSGVLVDISTKDLNEEQAKNVVELRDQIKATVDNLRSNTALLTNQSSLIAKDIDWYDLKQNQQLYESCSRVQEFFSRADLNKVQAYRLSVLLSSEVLKNEAFSNALNASADKSRAESLESGQRRGLLAFENALNRSKLDQYGLGSLSAQQYREIEATIRNLDSDSSYKMGMMVNEGVRNIFDITKDGFELYMKSKRGPKIGFR